MLSAEQVLQYFRFNGPSAPVLPCGVFVVGSTDRFRHTVNSQMTKSASLIHALVNSQQLDRRRTVGVLGGGPAGMMAGLRAAEFAAQATVFEKQDKVLSTADLYLWRGFGPAKGLYDARGD